MKTMTADQARALALRNGAELVIGGRHFNSTRAKVDKPATAAPTPPAPPITPATAAPAPAPAPVETFTKAEVELMLAKQEQRFTEQLTNMLAALHKPEDDGQGEFYATGFKPKMDKDGAITFVEVQWQRLQ